VLNNILHAKLKYILEKLSICHIKNTVYFKNASEATAEVSFNSYYSLPLNSGMQNFKWFAGCNY